MTVADQAASALGHGGDLVGLGDGPRSTVLEQDRRPLRRRARAEPNFGMVFVARAVGQHADLAVDHRIVNPAVRQAQ